MLYPRISELDLNVMLFGEIGDSGRANCCFIISE